MSVSVEVQRESAASDLPTDEDFQRWVEAALAAVDPAVDQSVEVVIRIVDETEGRRLNAAYRDRDYPTNVLSFPVDLDDLPESLRDSLESVPLGDLVICAPVVAREAAEQGKAAAAHWAHMVIHGCLHLLGFDHEIEATAVEMESIEIRIMSTLQFDNPYTVEHD